MHRRRLAALLVAATLPPATLARADGSPPVAGVEGTPVALSFESPPGCPTPTDFERRLTERGAQTRVPRSGEAARRVRATVESAASGVVGTLIVIETDGRSSRRSIRARDCREATDALALVTALAIGEADASPAPGAAAPRRDEAPPPTLPPRPAAPAAPRGTPGSASDSPASLAVPRDARPEAPGRMAARLGLEAVGALGMTPSASIGADVFAQLGWSASSGPFSPMLRVSFAAARDSSGSAPERSSRFAWLAVRAAVAPAAVSFARRGLAQIAFEGEYGGLRATTASGAPVQRPWAAAGGALLVSARIVGPLSVEWTAEGLFPLVRDEFWFGDGIVYRIPVFVGRMGLGASVVLR